MNEQSAQPVNEVPISSARQQTQPFQYSAGGIVTSRIAGKGRVVLPIAAGVVGLLALVGAIVYFTMFYISRADYARAATQTNAIVDAYNMALKATDGYITTAIDPKVSDTTITQKANDYARIYDDYASKVKMLAVAHAMKNSKVKTAYEQFVAKNNTFVTYSNTTSLAMPTLHMIAVHCSESAIGGMDTSDLSRVTDAYDAAVTPCTNALKTLAASKNVEVAKLANDGLTYYMGLRAHIVAMQAAYNANDRAAFESEYNNFLNGVNANSTIDSDATNIQKHQDSLSPDKELNNLASVIKTQK